MSKRLSVLIACLFATGFILSSCGGGSVGSSISLDITEPATTDDVDVLTLIVVTVTDVENIGIDAPASWSEVFRLRAIGGDTNLCTDDNITYDTAVSPNTITCNPGLLGELTQYAFSLSGLSDSEGKRIDSLALTFTTGALVAP